MTGQDSPFKKEDLELLLNLGRRLFLGQFGKVISKMEGMFNPDAGFAKTLKAKYDALIKAGFNEKQALEIALKAVEETLKQAANNSQNNGRSDG